MEYAVIAILILGFAVLLYFVFDLKRRSEKLEQNEPMKVMLEWMKEMKTTTESTRQNMQVQLDSTNKAINERLDNAGRVIGALSKELGAMSQIGPDIRRLTEVMASPKARGNFGEEMLEHLLAEVLPLSSFQSQYRFKNGEIVDIAIFLGDRVLPVDSKFSLENYRMYVESRDEQTGETLKKAFLRDVKKRVDEIHKKYILPQEGTFDIGLMYIPSEGVFMEVLADASIVQYAKDNKVHFVSPNTLYYWLQSILLSLKGQQINKVAQQVLDMVGGIKKESDKFGATLGTLSNHIKNAGNSMNSVVNEYQKLQTSIHNTADLQLDEAPEAKMIDVK
jgi:DNA recombination protein RmuC